MGLSVTHIWGVCGTSVVVKAILVWVSVGALATKCPVPQKCLVTEQNKFETG